MKDYDNSKESLYLKCLDVNHLYGWAMLQKLSVDGFEWVEDISEFNENFIKSYNEKSNEEYFLEVDVQYPETLHELHNDLPFLREGMKIQKVENLAANLPDKTGYVIHIRNLKQALNRGLVYYKS